MLSWGRYLAPVRVKLGQRKFAAFNWLRWRLNTMATEEPQNIQENDAVATPAKESPVVKIRTGNTTKKWKNIKKGEVNEVSEKIGILN